MGIGLDQSPRFWRAILIGLAALSFGCARSDVITAPHAAPFDSNAGIVQHKRWNEAYLAIGVVASNDGKSDVIWEVREAGAELWACHGKDESTGNSNCKRASFADDPDAIRKAIRLEAPPIARDVSAVAPDQLSSGSSADELGPRPVGVPRHGVWVTAPKAGLFSFGTALYHCVYDPGGPLCRVAEGTTFFSLGSLSRHIVTEGDRIFDVLWVVGFGQVLRCARETDEIRCVPVALSSGN